MPTPSPDPERPSGGARQRHFRPSTPADAATIAALLGEAGLHPVVRSEVEHWKYWQNDCGWSGARSFVLTAGASVVAHGAIVPGTLAWERQRISVLFAIDWAARPDAAGAGVTLMKLLGQMADGMLSVGGSAHTRRILPHLGFKPAGEVTSHVRTLRPLRMLGTRAPRWRLLPRVARSVWWTVTAPARGRDGFAVRHISSDTLSEIRPALPAPSADLAVFERSEASLRHALSCPLLPMELHALERSGSVQGYFLLALAGRQARLADCWMRTADPADWRALIQCAAQRARQHPQVAEIVAWASDPLLCRVLSECGFHERRAQPLGLLLRPGRTAPAATLRVQMLDTDAAWLDPHGESLLA